MALNSTSKLNTPQIFNLISGKKLVFTPTREDADYYYGYSGVMTGKINKADISTISNISDLYLDKFNLGGSTLLTQQSGTNFLKELSSSENFTTVAEPIFPYIPASWFNNGFPSTIHIKTTTGDLSNVIPIDFYAYTSGTTTFTNNNPPSDVSGFLNSNKVYSKTLNVSMTFREGDYLFSVLLKKDSYPQSKISVDSYWKLLLNFSNLINTNIVFGGQILPSGLNMPDVCKLAVNTGSTLNYSPFSTLSSAVSTLSSELSSSFNKNIVIDEYIDPPSNISFAYKTGEQNVALYQFNETYTLIPNPELRYKAYLLSYTDSGFPDYARAYLPTTAYTYASRYLSSVYVLKSNNIV